MDKSECITKRMKVRIMFTAYNCTFNDTVGKTLKNIYILIIKLYTTCCHNASLFISVFQIIFCIHVQGGDVKKCVTTLSILPSVGHVVQCALVVYCTFWPLLLKFEKICTL